MMRLVVYSAYIFSEFFFLSVDAVGDVDGGNIYISPNLTLAPTTSFPPTPYPSPIQTPPPIYMYNDWNTTTSVDVLVAALFLIAAGWLVLAIIYSVLILIVVRMRARGEFDIYDENFGRLFLLGTRCYIPLGCILRRHVVAMQSRNRRQSLHIMTREERRNAMELILTQSGDREQDAEKSEERGHTECAPEEDTTLDEGQRNEIDESEDEPMCSICLMEYEDGDTIFRSPSCVHRFHQDCVMDWLERRNHTECPCCREPMVSDEDVWETVQQLRREQRKLRRQENCRNSLIGRVFGCARKRTASEERDFERGQQLDVMDEDDEAAAEDYTAAPASHEVVNLTSDSSQNIDIEEGNLNEHDNLSGSHELSTKETINEVATKEENLRDMATDEDISSGSIETEDVKAGSISDRDELSNGERQSDDPDEDPSDRDLQAKEEDSQKQE